MSDHVKNAHEPSHRLGWGSALQSIHDMIAYIALANTDPQGNAETIRALQHDLRGLSICLGTAGWFPKGFTPACKGAGEFLESKLEEANK